MFLFSNICGCVPNLFLARGISCSLQCHKNHYMTLGLTPNASQADIKKAYFELCKKYHPDKNDGSVESTKRFREITEAYEILGNEKSRELYDRRMFYSGATSRQRTQRPEDYNYEAERHFYERAYARRRYTGKTMYYDFDAWRNAHYPKSRSEQYEFSNSRGRTWRHNRSDSPGYRGVRVPILSITVLGFIIISTIITGIPSLLYPTRYGIDNDLEYMRLRFDKSKLPKMESSNEKPSSSLS